MKNELRKMLDAQAKELKDKYGIKDSELDALLSLKGQCSVMETEVDVPCDDVIKRYKVSEAMEIVRCHSCIFFHSNSFWVVSRPTLANNMKGGALYEMLKWYCDFKDGIGTDDWSKQDYDNAETLCGLIPQILSLPLDVFTDIGFCVNVGNRILDERLKYYERLTKQAEKLKPETEEDAVLNDAFAQGVELAEGLRNRLEDENS